MSDEFSSPFEGLLKSYVKSLAKQRVCRSCVWLDCERRCRRLHVYSVGPVDDRKTGLTPRRSTIPEAGEVDIFYPDTFGCNQWEKKDDE